MSKQLIKELEILVGADVISVDTADNIRAYYKTKESSSPNTLTIILGILGTLLVSGGLLLVIAHNWDELSRVIKTTLSFLPLLAAQLLGIYTLLKKKDEKAWRECAAIFLFIANGASIALISQVYQVSGSLSGFILLWCCLGLPIIYIFYSSVVALLILATITWYTCIVGYRGYRPEIPYAYLLALACLVPHYITIYRKNAGSPFLNLLNWGAVISLAICAGTFTLIPSSWYKWMPVLYGTLFCLFIAIGRIPFFSQKSLGRNPFLVVGVPGILTLLLIWSFDFTDPWAVNLEVNLFSDPLPYLLLVMTALLIYFIAKQFNKPASTLYPEVFSFIVLFIVLMVLNNTQPAGQLTINTWILVIACFYIAKGARADNLTIMNFGLTILAVLSICRFFDSTIPFLWRALFFVTAGAGFFVANILVIRKRKQSKI